MLNVLSQQYAALGRATGQYCEEDAVFVRGHVNVLHHLQHVLIPSSRNIGMVQYDIGFSSLVPT